MSDVREAKIFRNGRNQAVRIPREFELPGDTVTMRREGERLIIEPKKSTGLLAYLDAAEPLDLDFPEIEDLPLRPVEL